MCKLLPILQNTTSIQQNTENQSRKSMFQMKEIHKIIITKKTVDKTHIAAAMTYHSKKIHDCIIPYHCLDDFWGSFNRCNMSREGGCGQVGHC